MSRILTFAETWRKKRLPQPPYFVVNKTCGRCLELGGDGSYQACQAFLRELQERFDAQFQARLERPAGGDKEKGYWDVVMFGQEFFVMRDREFGTCLWGPRPPADIHGFLRVAKLFGAREHLSLLKRVACCLWLDRPYA
jgi:hypothetical protein